jgi:hypothetical protein
MEKKKCKTLTTLREEMQIICTALDPRCDTKIDSFLNRHITVLIQANGWPLKSRAQYAQHDSRNVTIIKLGKSLFFFF